MSTSQLLNDGNFSDIAPASLPATNTAVAVGAPRPVGAWSADLGYITLISPYNPNISNYDSQLPYDAQRHVIGLCRDVAGALSQQIFLPRAGTVFVDFYHCRKPTAGGSGGATFGVDIVRDASDRYSHQISPYGHALAENGAAHWTSQRLPFPIGGQGTAYLRFLQGADTQGFDDGGTMITSVSAYYPYKPTGVMTSPTGNTVTVSPNQPFPAMAFSFTESTSGFAITNSNVTFTLANGNAGIRFTHSSSFSTNTDQSGNAALPAGVLQAGATGSVQDRLLVGIGGDQAASITLAVAAGGGSSQPPGSPNYRIVWAGAQDPLQITVNGTGQAVFQVQQQGTGAPVPHVEVVMTVNPGNTALRFQGGLVTYKVYTDGNGLATGTLSAGGAAGQANVAAGLASDPLGVATDEIVLVTQPAAPQYQFVWTGATSPLQMNTNDLAPAQFQLQSSNGASVANMNVQLTISADRSDLVFSATGTKTYTGYTDPSGNISTYMASGSIMEMPSVTASLISDPSVSLKEEIQIAQPLSSPTYTLIWVSAVGPLNIPETQTGVAAFRLQDASTGNPVSGQGISLDLAQNGTAATFADGTLHFSGTTGTDGTVSATVDAGTVAGSATLTASARGASSKQAQINITSLTVQPAAAVARAPMKSSTDGAI